MSFSGEKTTKIYRAVFGVALHLNSFAKNAVCQLKDMACLCNLCEIFDVRHRKFNIMITYLQMINLQSRHIISTECARDLELYLFL